MVMGYNGLYISNAAELGRHGDTKVAMIDGEPSHVNDEELNLLNAWDMDGDRRLAEEVIKEEGAGTTNPVTGMKEYWVVAAAKTAYMVGSFAYNLWKKDKHKNKMKDLADQAIVAAGEQREKEAALDLKDIEYQQNVSESNLTGGLKDLALQSTSASREVSSIAEAAGPTNLANVSSITRKADIAGENAWKSYDRSFQNIVATRKLDEERIQNYSDRSKHQRDARYEANLDQIQSMSV